MPTPFAIAERLRWLAPMPVQGNADLQILPLGGPSGMLEFALPMPELLPQLRIDEVSESGTVGEVLIESKLDMPLFLLDGLELMGAKQNRILNADVLVPAAAAIRVPVSCIEQGRWSRTSPKFGIGRNAAYRIRTGKSSRMLGSLRTSGRHDADQGQVWAEVGRTLAATSTFSPTSALTDAYSSQESPLAELRRRIVLPRNAVGMAVQCRGRLCGLDVFDKPATFEFFGAGLLEGYALDPTALRECSVPVGVESVLKSAMFARWDRFPAVGVGHDYRVDASNLSGSALAVEGSVVHLQLFPKPAGNGRPRIHRRGLR